MLVDSLDEVRIRCSGSSSKDPLLAFNVFGMIGGDERLDGEDDECDGLVGTAEYFAEGYEILSEIPTAPLQGATNGINVQVWKDRVSATSSPRGILKPNSSLKPGECKKARTPSRVKFNVPTGVGPGEQDEFEDLFSQIHVQNAPSTTDEPSSKVPDFLRNPQKYTRYSLQSDATTAGERSDLLFETIRIGFPDRRPQASSPQPRNQEGCEGDKLRPATPNEELAATANGRALQGSPKHSLLKKGSDQSVVMNRPAREKRRRGSQLTLGGDKDFEAMAGLSAEGFAKMECLAATAVSPPFWLPDVCVLDSSRSAESIVNCNILETAAASTLVGVRDNCEALPPSKGDASLSFKAMKKGVRQYRTRKIGETETSAEDDSRPISA